MEELGKCFECGKAGFVPVNEEGDEFACYEHALAVMAANVDYFMSELEECLYADDEAETVVEQAQDILRAWRPD